jgi:hypothetical protein
MMRAYGNNHNQCWDAIRIASQQERKLFRCQSKAIWPSSSIPMPPSTRAILNGVQAITEDAAWVSEVLGQAFHTDPLLNFIFGDTINAPGKLDWFFRVTFRPAALYGDCFSTVLPERQGMGEGRLKIVVLMMLPGFEVVSTKEIPSGGLHNWVCCDKRDKDKP